MLLAYAKLDLDAEILASKLPDDAAFASDAGGLFPRKQAAEQYAGELAQHRLKREIVSTSLANRLVNLAGPVLVCRLKEMTGASGAEVARAFVVAEGAFGLQALKQRIDALDGKIAAEVQIRFYGEIADILRRLGLWFLTHADGKDDLAATIALYRAGVEGLRGFYKDVISGTEQVRGGRRAASPILSKPAPPPTWRKTLASCPRWRWHPKSPNWRAAPITAWRRWRMSISASAP